MRNTLITISGSRGSGKDATIAKLLERFAYMRLHRVIPCTTRERREGELHGREQYFLSEEEFAQNEQDKKFIFTNPLNASGYRSGTLKSELIHNFSIVDITSQGAVYLREYMQANNGRVFSYFLFTDHQTRFDRIKNRQKNLKDVEVEELMAYDPTIPYPEAHPDWFTKIRNDNGLLDETVNHIIADIKHAL